MHSNRTQFTLPEYQEKLRNGASRCGICLLHSESGDQFIFHPKPNCPWLPETRSKYFGKIRSKFKYLSNNRKYTFGTLTYSSRLYTPIEAAKRLKHDLDLFFKRLGYYMRKPEYFYVIELTANYMVHIHLIFDRYIPWKKLRNSWYKTTGCPVVNIKGIKSKQVFFYVTKYTTNSQKQNDSLWGFIFSHIDRVWTASRKFYSSAEKPKSQFLFLFSFVSSQIQGFSEDSFQSLHNISENDLILLYRDLELQRSGKLINVNIPISREIQSDPALFAKNNSCAPENLQILFSF